MNIVINDEPQKGGVSWKVLELPMSIACYSTCSVSMILINKLVIGRKGFDFPFVLIFFQNASATALVMLLKMCGIIDYPGLDRKIVRRWVPLTLLFVGMLVTSLLALKTMSVPLQTLIKSTAIVTTAVGDHFLFGHTFNRTMLFAFLMLSSGSLMGAATDAWLTAAGLFWSLSNVACTSGYQLYMKGVLNDLKGVMGKWGPVHYNNVLSLPPLLFPVVLQYEGWSKKLRETSYDAEAIGYITAMVFLSAVMTMASFWCMSTTSPTTYGVIGGMNRIPLNILGIWIFDQMPTNIGIVGICASIAGGFLYTYALNIDKVGQASSVTLSPAVILAQFRGNTTRRSNSSFTSYSLSDDTERRAKENV